MIDREALEFCSTLFGCITSSEGVIKIELEIYALESAQNRQFSRIFSKLSSTKFGQIELS